VHPDVVIGLGQKVKVNVAALKNGYLAWVALSIYLVSKKVRHFCFYNNIGNSRPIFIHFFTVKYRKDLWSKLEYYHLP